MQLRPWFYNLLYRLHAAPWDKQVRQVLVELVESGRLDPASLPTVLDLGCGTGAESAYLASHGFSRVDGVDFSPVAIRQARRRAEAAGVTGRCHFHQADLTAGPPSGLAARYDLICDFGTVDDLAGSQRQAAAALITRLCRPGGKVLEFAFQADKAELSRPARLTPMFAPGEEKELYSGAFDIEYLPTRPRTVMLLMTRRPV
jgi:SAM-dependent methyltransferase